MAIDEQPPVEESGAPAPEPATAVLEAPPPPALLQGTPQPAEISARKPKCPYCGGKLTADPSTSVLFAHTAFCDVCGVRHRLVD